MNLNKCRAWYCRCSLSTNHLFMYNAYSIPWKHIVFIIICKYVECKQLRKHLHTFYILGVFLCAENELFCFCFCFAIN